MATARKARTLSDQDLAELISPTKGALRADRAAKFAFPLVSVL